MIKHMYISLAYCGKPEEDNYLCNPVPIPKEEKIVYYWEKVTCKNCLMVKA